MATLTIADLDNGKRDLQTVDEVANSPADSTTTRYGDNVLTLAGALRRLGYKAPVPYASELAVDSALFTVSRDGVIYAPDPSLVPFTTGAWNAAQWRPVQNTTNTNQIYQFPTLEVAQAAAATLPEGSAVIVEGASQGHAVAGGYVPDSLIPAANVADYAELTAYDGKASRFRVTGILGMSAPQGISGDFEVIPGNTTSLSDGGTIFVLADGRRVKRVFSGAVQLGWWGVRMNGDDATVAFQSAMALGYDIDVSSGWCECGPVTVPQAMIGRSIRGGGYSHWDYQKGHTIRAKTVDQPHIFRMDAGTDNVTFEGLRIDGASKAKKNIDAAGGFINVTRCGVYGAKEYGFDSSAGLNRITSCYFKNDGIGARVFSDSHITDSEFSGGTTPLVLAAGGNRVIGSLMNSGSVSCLRIENYDASTNNANTDIIGCYIGETYSGNVQKPVIEIYGSASRKIRDVRFIGGYIISAEVPAAGGKLNGLVRIDNANGVTFSGVGAQGVGYFATANIQTNYYINATNSDNITVSGGVAKGFNGAPFVLGAGMGTVSVGGGLIVDGWGIQSSGDGLAAIVHSSGFLKIGDVSVISSEASTYLLKTYNASAVDVLGPDLRYSNATVMVAATGEIAGIWKRAGAQHPHAQRISIANLIFSAQAAAPASPSYGQVYLDGNLGKLRIWLGSSWSDLN